jgi:hypothetical protein
MPTPSRALTNSYQDCKLVKLDADDPASPLVVLQEGYAPNDASCRMRMFYLQRDGFWIDEVARSTRPENEIGDIVFDTSADAIKTLSGLFGKPIIRELPVTEADVQRYMTQARGGKAQDLFRHFLARYRASKPRA